MEDSMELAFLYRWAIFILFLAGIVLLVKHRILTPFVFWSRIQYYTITTIVLFALYQGLICFEVDIPFLYTADCHYMVAASLYTLFIMYHLLVAPGAIQTHKLNDIEYEHYSFYNFVFHYIIPQLVMIDWLFLVDKSDAHWQSMFLWMIYPALYVVFVYLRAWLTILFHGRSNLYPYIFMDPGRCPPWDIIKNVLIVGAEFFGIGVCCYLAGMLTQALGLTAGAFL